MSHHYGRHGPHAWLRWRNRHARLSLVPAVAKTDVAIVHVRLPANAERIIFIIMTNEPFDEENPENRREIQIVGGQVVDGITPPTLIGRAQEPSPDEGELRGKAHWQAFNDAREIERLHGNGYFVQIDRPRVENRIKGLVNKYFEQNSENGGLPPNRSEYRRLVNVVIETYQQRLNEELDADPERISYLKNAEEVCLRTFAIQDREESPSSPAERGYHIRDIAVIRVLQVLNIPLDAAKDRLPSLHQWIDKYQGYYSSPRKEVSWPSDQEPF